MARVASACAVAYVAAVLISVVVAHALHVAAPHWGLADRILQPLAAGLEFIDTHWKAALLLGVPFLAPVVRDLVPRLRKIWGFEFDPVPELVSASKGEKPAARRTGAQRP